MRAPPPRIWVGPLFPRAQRRKGGARRHSAHHLPQHGRLIAWRRREGLPVDRRVVRRDAQGLDVNQEALP